jgi:hypothetical protein
MNIVFFFAPAFSHIPVLSFVFSLLILFYCCFSFWRRPYFSIPSDLNFFIISVFVLLIASCIKYGGSISFSYIQDMSLFSIASILALSAQLPRARRNVILAVICIYSFLLFVVNARSNFARAVDVHTFTQLYASATVISLIAAYVSSYRIDSLLQGICLFFAAGYLIVLPIGSLKISVVLVVACTFLVRFFGSVRSQSVIPKRSKYQQALFSLLSTYIRIFLLIVIFWAVFWYFLQTYGIIFMSSVSYAAKVAGGLAGLSFARSHLLLGAPSFDYYRQFLAADLFRYFPIETSADLESSLMLVTQSHNLFVDNLAIYGLIVAPFSIYITFGPIFKLNQLFSPNQTNFAKSFSLYLALAGIPIALTHNTLGVNFFQVSWLLYVVSSDHISNLKG